MMQLSLTLGVADLDQCEDFYREVLNLAPQRGRVAEQFPEYLLLRCAETCIIFRPLAHLQAQHPALRQNLCRHPLGVGVQLELSCPDLTQIRQNIARCQWPVAYELDDDEHQRSEIWLHDPDGYLLVLNEEA
jgi:catechol 2,3-dioxygenase-like lactoylglutathione lyase family enzyme